MILTMSRPEPTVSLELTWPEATCLRGILLPDKEGFSQEENDFEFALWSKLTDILGEDDITEEGECS